MNNIIFTNEITVKLIDRMGGDHFVVAAAKVSTSGNEALSFAEREATESNFGLINYLVKQKHGTPFEHGSLIFFVEAPIFVWREHHRHRVGFSYNETSGRYKQLEPKFWEPKPERKIVPVENYKPSRPEFQSGTREQHLEICETIQKSCVEAYDSYSRMLDKGYAKEVARAVLPVGIYSSCWVTCNPRSLMHFLGLRTHDKTAKYVSYPQSEIEEVARQYESEFAKHWPLTYKAFIENGRVAP